MFCPVCRAEYRPGFTRCADCDVDLVDSIAEHHNWPDSKRDDGNETAVVVYAGVDPRIAEAICETLTRADIDYTDEQPKSLLLPALRDGMHEIRVRSGDLDAAKKAIADHWGLAAHPSDENAENEETPSEALSKAASSHNPFNLKQPVFSRSPDETTNDEQEDESDGEPIPEDYAENFDPEEATIPIWSGEDSEMAQIFDDCLSNVGIGCVLKVNAGKTEVYVMPAAEKRAREVVREIEEATPME